MTSGLAAGPDKFDGRSRYNSWSPSGRPSGCVAAGEGPTATILKGPVQLRDSFSLITLLSTPLCKSLSYGGVGVVYPYPTAGPIFGAAKKRNREGRVLSVYTSNCESVMFAHKLVCVLLSFTGEVAIGEVVPVKALVASAVGAVEDGEGEAR